MWCLIDTCFVYQTVDREPILAILKHGQKIDI
jgi:hypothetical protein